MADIKSKAQRETERIVRSLFRHRAAQRQLAIRPRYIISVLKLKGADFRVNRHEVKIDIVFATTGNPIEMIDKVLDSVEHYQQREYEERARKITEVKSEVLQRMAYLERTLSHGEYEEFILSLLPEQPIPIEDLAPDIDLLALIAEGEYLTQIVGTYFNA